MNNDKLHDAMNYLDDDLIAEVAQIRDASRLKKRRRRLLASIALAACFCIVVTVLVVGYNIGRSPADPSGERADGILGDTDITSDGDGESRHDAAADDAPFEEDGESEWRDELTEKSETNDGAESEAERGDEVIAENDQVSFGCNGLDVVIQGYEGEYLVCNLASDSFDMGLKKGGTVYVKPYEDAEYTFFVNNAVIDIDVSGGPILKSGTLVRVRFDKYEGNVRNTVCATKLKIY